MAAAQFKIFGTAELANQFASMPKSIRNTMIRSELRGALKPVLAAAKSLARRKTGAMAMGLKLRKIKTKKSSVIGYYVRTATRAELSRTLSRQALRVASKLIAGKRIARKTRAKFKAASKSLRSLDQGMYPRYYPAHIELGTSKQKAYPYLRPAFDANRSTMEQAIIEGINEALEEAARGK